MNRRIFLKLLSRLGVASVIPLDALFLRPRKQIVPPPDYVACLIKDSKHITERINAKLPAKFVLPSVRVPEVFNAAFGGQYFVGPKLCIKCSREDFINQYVSAVFVIERCAGLVGAKRVEEISWRQLIDNGENYWSDYAQPFVAFST